jgi:hypothetical protein
MKGTPHAGSLMAFVLECLADFTAFWAAEKAFELGKLVFPLLATVGADATDLRLAAFVVGVVDL